MRPIEKYLDEVKMKAGIKTDCELSRQLGIKQPSLVKIRNGENTPSEETCKKLSEIAKDPYEKVLLLAQVSKASETSRKAWEHILKAAAQAGVFTLGLLLFSMAAPTLAQAASEKPAPAPAQNSFDITRAVYPLCDISLLFNSTGSESMLTSELKLLTFLN